MPSGLEPAEHRCAASKVPYGCRKLKLSAFMAAGPKDVEEGRYFGRKHTVRIKVKHRSGQVLRGDWHPPLGSVLQWIQSGSVFFMGSWKKWRDVSTLVGV